jgi:PAS domain S-box-containing protein
LGQLTFGLGFLILYLLAGVTLDRNGLALSLVGNAAVVCSAALVILTINRRRRQWAGCQRLFWDTFAVGMAIWILGHLGWAYAEVVGRSPGWLAWHTVFSLSGGAAPLLALVARPHRGIRQHATGAVGVDIASYGLLTGFVYAYFVLIPDITNVNIANRALLMSVQVFRFLLMGGMCIAGYAARRTAWGPTYQRLAIGVTIGAILRLATNSAIVNGTYHIGTFYDFAWIGPYLFYAWAAREAPASPEAAETDDAEERPSGLTFAVLSAMPVLLIPIIGYAAVPLGSSDPEAASFRALLTGMATVGGLGLLTLRLVVQRGQLKRADAWARLLGAATEQTGDLIVIARADGSVEYANDAFQRAVGFNRRELSLLKFPQPLDASLATLADEIPAELRKQGVWRGTLRRRRRDGTAFAASSTVVALRNGSGAITHFVSVERDVTDELKLRDQLVHSERLSAVGELVAGVAHEINNPLQAIVGCVELLLDDHADRALMRRDLEIVRREAGRAGHIVRNLLSFVRRSAPNRVPADLNYLVKQTAELREYHLHQQNINLLVQCTSESLPVLVDREEIQQVVLNLLLNAEQAIESLSGHGTIIIRTMHLADRQIVEVLDDGPGIRLELRGRIFEPFFTTKEMGEGTGLGLSISHGIAASHGGALETCESAMGACFRLTLPAHQSSAVPSLRALMTGAGAAPTRVLVVDDEEPIRRLLGRLLARRGYEVAEGTTVDEAVALVASFKPGLVICDVRMPDGGGVALHRRVREAHGEIAPRFILITGDLAAVEALEAAVSDVAILAKPFTASDLDALLAQIAPVRAG